MNHWGGQAANAFGGVSQPAPLSTDAEHNILAAMVRWVEEGVAPSTIIGVKYKNDVKANGVAFTRPLCKYPSTVRFRGGNPNNASSFVCA
ncbi:tannase-domain-containing protein [Trametes polyzona]|nr:tannase-domain-containing protein [Trametes polyzona]